MAQPARNGPTNATEPGAVQPPPPEACSDNPNNPAVESDVSRRPPHAPSAPEIFCPPTALHQSDDEASASASCSTAATDEPRAPSRRVRPYKSVPATFFAGSYYNGFKTIDEPPAISCTEEFMALYSLPAEALTYEPCAGDIITCFRNGDRERKVHNNTILTSVELDQLAAMKVEAKAQGLAFYPSVTSMATRFLSLARNDPNKAIKYMQETQRWREQYFQDGPVTDAQVEADLAHGIVYFTGRDQALRPAIVVRAARIPKQWYRDRSLDKFIRLLVFCMEYFLRYMVVPGRVENLSVIVDLSGLCLSQVPLGPLGEVYRVMSHHYSARVFKFYVCNMPPALSAIAGLARNFLTDRQKQKLNVLDDVKALRADFALHQLEEDFGGSRPNFSSFFPFALNPGPYTAGFAGAQDTSAAPDVHRVQSETGAIGRLWDPKQSAEQNTRLEYCVEAIPILERCGLPVPQELRVEFQTPTGTSTGKCFSATAARPPLSPRSATPCDDDISSQDATPVSPGEEPDAPFDFEGVGVDEVPSRPVLQDGGRGCLVCWSF